MKTYECENCGSLFILNETDERVESGDYSFVSGCHCPLCFCGMVLIGVPESEKEV